MEINSENMKVSKHIVWSQMQLFTGNKMIVLHILKNTILVQLQHTCHVSRIFQESPSLSNNSQSHHFRVASPILHWVTMFYLFMFNWLGWVIHMPLSAAIFHSLFEAITFHLGNQKKLYFSIGKLNHLIYWDTKNWCQPH